MAASQSASPRPAGQSVSGPDLPDPAPSEKVPRYAMELLIYHVFARGRDEARGLPSRLCPAI